MVEIGQTVANMDTEELEAQLREAKANLRRVRGDKNYATAVVAQRESELDFAQKELTRSRALVMKGHVSREQLDQDQTRQKTADAALQAASTQVLEAGASIEAAVARTERIQYRLMTVSSRHPVVAECCIVWQNPGRFWLLAAKY